jgi:hypothetical protein
MKIERVPFFGGCEYFCYGEYDELIGGTVGYYSASDDFEADCHRWKVFDGVYDDCGEFDSSGEALKWIEENL